MSIIRRAFAVGFCASIFLIGGCTTNVQQPSDLSARSHDPRGLISGLPAAGEAVCLTAASDHSPTGLSEPSGIRMTTPFSGADWLRGSIPAKDSPKAMVKLIRP